ncbi:peptidoglycan bridge formation glycyltransferase FemA/FemB family protein [Candidatus Saccharibacteria bacterium]|nr:peptidoglycan bridge formation glycyltransferase FemA/FemB family protein [Candidatus Saccharibacteria bacterium]
MKAPITQSLEWKKLQDDLGEISFFEQGNGYQYLAILKSTPAGKYLYLPYGPVFTTKQGLENSLKSLQNLAKRESAFFIRVEPQSKVFVDHLPTIAQKSTDLNPAETWVLDLNQDDLDAKLPSRLLRYYKAAAKKGITIETSQNPADIHYLLDLQKQLAKEKGISTFSEDYLKTELAQPFATLYLVKHEDPHRRVVPPEGAPRDVFTGEEAATGPVETVIAAGLVFDDRTTRYNLQGAQNEQGRKLHATGILTIQLIKDAAAAGKQTFDFWGIAPEGAPDNHPWAGFTNFKKTFAGREVVYSGTYDLVLNPSRYRHYKILRKLNRLIRR